MLFVGGGTTAAFNGAVTINDLSLVNGYGKGGETSRAGGAAGMGGAIFQNGGNLALSNVLLSGNTKTVNGGFREAVAASVATATSLMAGLAAT